MDTIGVDVKANGQTGLGPIANTSHQSTFRTGNQFSTKAKRSQIDVIEVNFAEQSFLGPADIRGKVRAPRVYQ